MKILFAADVSFNYYGKFQSVEQAQRVMNGTAEVFRSADFSMLNLENIFGNAEDHTPIYKSGPNLISSEDFVAFIDTLKPTAIGLANNHTGDFGEAPIFNTMNLLKKKGYLLTGAGANVEEAYRPVGFEKDGVQVAVFAVCENEFGTAKKNAAGSAGYDLTRVTHAIAGAREKGQLPIIYFHGGNESNPFPSTGKVALYRHFVDLGAAAVIAMHTHCPQGYEFYRGCPIVYSMGNFFFPDQSDRSKKWTTGYMTMLDITAESAKLDVIPYTFGMDHHTVMTGAEKEYFMNYLAFLNQEMADEDKLQRYFEAWCVIDGINGYTRNLNYRKEMLEEPVHTMTALKNLFSCEAHDELMRVSLNLIYEGRHNDLQPEIDMIRKLQNLEF